MIEMELVGISVETQTNTPVVLLRESPEPKRALPIFVGAPEAASIAYAVQGVEPPRPMTHDLLCQILDTLGAVVERVVISELRDSTFLAELHVRHAGELHALSARPSDAIAIAVRTKCALFADEAVVAEASVEFTDDDGPAESRDPDELVDEFKQFIEQINPEDFGGAES